VVEEAGAHGAASDDHALRLVAHGVPLSCFLGQSVCSNEWNVPVTGELC
jgi:hypothetical protein